MQSFLSKIWGEGTEGHLCIVSGKRMQHEFYPSIHGVLPNIARHASQKKDVWYAPAILATSERKIPNAIAVKALWLDIDIKPDKEGCYSDFYDGAFKLKEFCEAIGLPDPTVVKSGNGLHVYWIFNDFIKPVEWHALAGALREACIEHNLLADHQITTDIVRLLRVPDTYNYKDKANPKQVELLTGITTYDHTEIAEALSQYTFRAELRKDAEKVNRTFAVDLPQTPKDANKIADACPQLEHFRSSKGNLPEPEWYAGLGVLALCVDGERIAQEWSSGHAEYSPEATTAKFERAKEFAPTTCEKFATVAPERCRSCPMFGKITTPVQLGETVTEIERPKVEIATPDSDQPVELDIPLPTGYVVGKEGVFLMIPGDDENPPEKKIIFTQPVWVSRVMVGEDGAGSEIELSWTNDNGITKSACFKQSLVAVDSQLEGWLYDQNIYGVPNIKVAKMYLKSGIATVARALGEQTVYDKFGSTEKGFLIGSDLITTKHRERARISSKVDPRRVDMMQSKGSLDAWTRITKLLDKPNFWMHRFAVLAGIASPLFSLTGTQGSVLSLAGESSGGKTTSANLGVSAYGNPQAFTVEPKTTVKAFYEHWRQVNNLPLIINEAGTIKREYLSDLVYAAANGKARDRLRQDGTMVNSGGWATLTIFTSNVHLMSMPERDLGEAERRRVIEFTFTHENLMDIDTGSAISECVRENHGIAGRVFVEHILKNRERIIKRAAEYTDTLQHGIHSMHRFGVWMVANVAVAAEIVNELGLIDFATDDVIRNAVGTLKDHADSVTTPDERVVELIAEYTTRYQQGIAIRDSKHSLGWIQEPLGEARGRWNVAGGKRVELCLPSKQFRAFCLENNVDINHIRQFGDRRKVRTMPVRLSQNSNPIQCYVIPYPEGEAEECI